MTNDEARLRQLKMFGCTAEEIEAAIESWSHSPKPRLALAMSILSDAQELLVSELDEAAQQHINRAKYLILRETEPA
jgi:hypothetical protein